MIISHVPYYIHRTEHVGYCLVAPTKFYCITHCGTSSLQQFTIYLYPRVFVDMV